MYLLNRLAKTGPRTIRQYSSCNEYIQVPHYREKSALFIRQPLPSDKTNSTPIFPRLITPDLNLKSLFQAENMYKTALSISLNARHFHLDLKRLKDDYLEMKNLSDKVFCLEQNKLLVSEKINSLVKSGGKAAKKTSEFQELINQGNQLKTQINQILEELIPLEEIVNIACLRLPNSLHVSSLLVHALQSNTDFKPHFSLHTNENEVLSEENNSIVIFRMNDKKTNGQIVNWRHVLENNNPVSATRNG